jgi:hypothetical protein
MNRLLAVLGALTFVLLFIGTFWWLRAPEASATDGKPLTHMHCPELVICRARLAAPLCAHGARPCSP